MSSERTGHKNGTEAKDTTMKQPELINHEHGGVTVEVACGMIAIVFVTALVFSGLSLALSSSKVCADARDVARSAAIGETPPITQSIVTWESDGTWVKVRALRTVPAGVLLGHEQVECEMQTRDERTL